MPRLSNDNYVFLDIGDSAEICGYEVERVGENDFRVSDGRRSGHYHMHRFGMYLNFGIRKGFDTVEKGSDVLDSTPTGRSWIGSPISRAIADVLHIGNPIALYGEAPKPQEVQSLAKRHLGSKDAKRACMTPIATIRVSDTTKKPYLTRVLGVFIDGDLVQAYRLGRRRVQTERWSKSFCAVAPVHCEIEDAGFQGVISDAEQHEVVRYCEETEGRYKAGFEIPEATFDYDVVPPPAVKEPPKGVSAKQWDVIRELAEEGPRDADAFPLRTIEALEKRGLIEIVAEEREFKGPTLRTGSTYTLEVAHLTDKARKLWETAD